MWKDLYILQAALMPEKTFMQALLHATSQDWELSQHFNHITRQSREYRLLELHKGGLLQTFYAESSSVYLSLVAWAQFLETELFRSRLLAVFMRCAAVVFQLVEVRVKGYPYKLFSMLEPALLESTAREAEAAPKCMLDQWTRRFLDRYHGEALRGAEPRAVLELICGLGMGTTFTTERLHSKNLLRAKLRLSKRPDLHYLSLTHMGFSVPNSCLTSLPAPRSLTGRRCGRPRKPQEEGDGSAGSRGGGGAWRAFISVNLGGRQLSGPVSAQLSQQYKALSAEQKAYYEQLGDVGSTCMCLPTPLACHDSHGSKSLLAK